MSETATISYVNKNPWLWTLENLVNPETPQVLSFEDHIYKLKRK